MSMFPDNAPQRQLDSLRAQAVSRWQDQTARYTVQISVGMATCGVSAGAEAVWQALAEEIRQSGRDDIALERVGCIGQCHAEPLVEIAWRGKAPSLYGGVTPEHARALVRGLLHGNPPLDKLLVDGCSRYRLYLLGDGADRTAYRQHLAEVISAVAQAGVAESTQLFEADCLLPPFQGTLLLVAPGETAYGLRNPGDAARIIEQHLRDGGIPSRSSSLRWRPFRSFCIPSTSPPSPSGNYASPRATAASSIRSRSIRRSSPVNTWRWPGAHGQTPERGAADGVRQRTARARRRRLSHRSEMARYPHGARRAKVSYLQCR